MPNNAFHGAGRFLYPLKYQVSKGFLMFSGGTERKQKYDMG